MCEQLGQLREAMGRYAAGFDASLLSCDDSALVVAEAAVIESVAATVKGLAAARSAAGEGWKAAGDRSAAAHLARVTGTSVRAAGEVLETARRLERLPAPAAAARAGALSPGQVAAVASAADVARWPGWRTTTGWTGPPATPRCSTCWTGCVRTTTTSRPSTTGRWWRGGGNGPSCRRMTPAIPGGRRGRRDAARPDAGCVAARDDA